ncbi:MAG: heavy metal-associated domain-containing protein [Balneolaceae bacterium]
MISLKTMIGLITLAAIFIIGLIMFQNGNSSTFTLAADEQDIELEVNGLYCSNCVRNCERWLEKLDEVEKASVNLDENRAFIKLKEDRNVSKEQISEAIEDAGFEAGEFTKFPGDDKSGEE